MANTEKQRTKYAKEILKLIPSRKQHLGLYGQQIDDVGLATISNTYVVYKGSPIMSIGNANYIDGVITTLNNTVNVIRDIITNEDGSYITHELNFDELQKIYNDAITYIKFFDGDRHSKQYRENFSIKFATGKNKKDVYFDILYLFPLLFLVSGGGKCYITVSDYRGIGCVYDHEKNNIGGIMPVLVN